MEPSDKHWPSWNVFNWQSFLRWMRWPPAGFASFIYFLLFILSGALIVALVVSVAKLATVAWGSVTPDSFEAAKILVPTLLALLGAPFLIWRLVTGHWQAVAARRQADVALSKQEIDRHNNISTIISKSLELLGSTRERKSSESIFGQPQPVTVTETVPNMEARCGALLLLSRISKDNPEYSTVILSAICAYVRDQSWFDRYGRSMVRPDSAKESVSRPRADLEIAFGYIVSRSERERSIQFSENQWLDLSRANLSAHSFGPNKIVYLLLHQATLSSISAFQTQFHSMLAGQATFFNAQFENVSFENSKLINCKYDGAHFRNVKFKNCELKKTAPESILTSELSFYSCQFTDILFDFYPSTLIGQGNTFSGCQYFDGAKFITI